MKIRFIYLELECDQQNRVQVNPMALPLGWVDINSRVQAHFPIIAQSWPGVGKYDLFVITKDPL